MDDPERAVGRVLADEQWLDRERMPRADRALEVAVDLERHGRIRVADRVVVEQCRRVLDAGIGERAAGRLPAELSCRQHRDDDDPDDHRGDRDVARGVETGGAAGRCSRPASIPGRVVSVLPRRGAALATGHGRVRGLRAQGNVSVGLPTSARADARILGRDPEVGRGPNGPSRGRRPALGQVDEVGVACPNRLRPIPVRRGTGMRPASVA